MKVALSDIATNITLREPGLWAAAHSSTVSYPDEGNDICFALEDHSFWFQHRNRCIAQLVRTIPPPGLLFDVGGGNGVVTQALQREGIESILVEPGWRGIVNAQARGLQPIIWATLEGAGFLPHTLPAVGLFDVLEHISDDAGFLRTLKHLLRQGGCLYLSVPAYRWLWSAEDDYAGHQRRYNRQQLIDLLHASGFRIEFASYIFSLLPLPIFCLRTLPSWLGLRSSANPAVHQREHQRPSPRLAHFLQRLFDYEVQSIAQRRSLPFGGSCLIAARSIDQ